MDHFIRSDAYSYWAGFEHPSHVPKSCSGREQSVSSLREQGGGSSSCLKDPSSSGRAGPRGDAGLAAPALPPAVSWRWLRALRRSWHSAGTEAARAAAGVSGDEAALPPGFYLFLFSEKKQLRLP